MVHWLGFESLEHSPLSGRTSSDLVKDPPTPSVSTNVQQFDQLFQLWIDEDEEFPPTPTAPVNAPAVQAPEIAIATPSTTLISEGAPTVTITSNNIIIIPLKWIFKIRLDEYGEVLKNKAWLVAKGYR
nr:retrovirus-related Pol polyprotein from transposon TNT 1-94 [Tanacetum cinerariifolium]